MKPILCALSSPQPGAIAGEQKHTSVPSLEGCFPVFSYTCLSSSLRMYTGSIPMSAARFCTASTSLRYQAAVVLKSMLCTASCLACCRPAIRWRRLMSLVGLMMVHLKVSVQDGGCLLAVRYRCRTAWAALNLCWPSMITYLPRPVEGEQGKQKPTVMTVGSTTDGSLPCVSCPPPYPIEHIVFGKKCYVDAMQRMNDRGNDRGVLGQHEQKGNIPWSRCTVSSSSYGSLMS